MYHVCVVLELGSNIYTIEYLYGAQQDVEYRYTLTVINSDLASQPGHISPTKDECKQGIIDSSNKAACSEVPKRNVEIPNKI